MPFSDLLGLHYASANVRNDVRWEIFQGCRPGQCWIFEEKAKVTGRIPSQKVYCGFVWDPRVAVRCVGVESALGLMRGNLCDRRCRKLRLFTCIEWLIGLAPSPGSRGAAQASAAEEPRHQPSPPARRFIGLGMRNKLLQLNPLSRLLQRLVSPRRGPPRPPELQRGFLSLRFVRLI
jgi:hypothetical protein